MSKIVGQEKTQIKLKRRMNTKNIVQIEPNDTMQYHRLTENSTHTFSYDARGNLILKQEKGSNKQIRYTWNALGQLIKVQTSTDILSYTYDPFGRRVTKTHASKDKATVRHRYL